MNAPKSFKPYHGCFGRFQGCLDISANFNPGEWTEAVGKKGKRMRSKRFAHSVAIGPSNISQAGTNLRSALSGLSRMCRPPVRSMGTGYQYSSTLSYRRLHRHTMLRVFLLG
jgi:hypothetical protein